MKSVGSKRIKEYTGYLKPGYYPQKNDLLVEFYLEPAKGLSLSEAAQRVAAESSVGTWTDIATMKPSIAKKLKPHVYYLNNKTNTIKIAYPMELFEAGNIPQLLSSIAGNVFGMKDLENLRLQDINFPTSYLKAFKGPKYGIKGIRKIMKVKKRPLVGTIVKPKLGLNEKEHAQVAFNAWIGGCDIVKDDENLTDMVFNDFEKRIDLTLKAKREAERITGEKKIYMPNVTAETQEMLDRALYVKKLKGEYVMVDLLTAGFSGVQTLRRANLGMVLHAHRAMHAAITRTKEHGISMLAIAKLCRLAGLDQLHIGTAVGKMEGPAQEIEAIREQIEEYSVKKNEKTHVLGEKWYHIKPTFAVCSGGLHPGHVPDLMKFFGTDIIIQMGGGIHGHPYGTIAGATAARQAVDAVMKGVSLEQYSKDHEELRLALEKWCQKPKPKAKSKAKAKKK